MIQKKSTLKNSTTPSIGDIHARDGVINTFLKNKPEGVKEISINYTDKDGNIKQQKVEDTGKVDQGSITQASDKAYYQALQKKSARLTSKSKAFISAKDWDRIFGKR